MWTRKLHHRHENYSTVCANRITSKILQSSLDSTYCQYLHFTTSPWRWALSILSLDLKTVTVSRWETCQCISTSRVMCDDLSDNKLTRHPDTLKYVLLLNINSHCMYVIIGYILRFESYGSILDIGFFTKSRRCFHYGLRSWSISVWVYRCIRMYHVSCKVCTCVHVMWLWVTRHLGSGPRHTTGLRCYHWRSGSVHTTNRRYYSELRHQPYTGIICACRGCESGFRGREK